MSKKDSQHLLKFLKSIDNNTVELVLWLRDFAWDLCPEANELIYDNYNAIAFGWSPTERLGHTICTIAVLRSNKNIHFGFYWGSELSDPEKMLLGKGNQYRYLLVTDKNKFPKKYIKKLVLEAYSNSLSKIKDPKEIISGKTIVKSISLKKRISKTN
ncbi:MAG: hypothetical protein ACJ748_10610 [Flavisolibacter sp.]